MRKVIPRVQMEKRTFACANQCFFAIMQIICHFSQLIQQSAERYGDRIALQYRDYAIGRWRGISWNAFARRVDQTARSLVALEVGVQESVAVFSQNKPESLFVEFGAFRCRAIEIPFYATTSGAQVQFMVNDAAVRVIFVGEQQQYDTVWSVIGLCHSLEHIVFFDETIQRHPNDQLSISFSDFLKIGSTEPRYEAEVQKRVNEARFEDMANILYTSGTTGTPKGVILLHSQYHFTLSAHTKVLNIGTDDVVINFLPFSHVFEGGWAKLCLSCGAQLAINLRPLDIQKSMREVHPTCMSAVPRFWEKVYQGVLDKMESGSALQRCLIKDALKVGAEMWEKYRSKGLRPPLALQLKYAAYDKTLLRLLRKTLGLDRPNLFPVAGATISPEIERFVHAAGFNMLAGYGLTETCASVSFDHSGERVTTGSIGRPLPGIEVKIGENNEILVKGATVMPGYYKKAEETKAAFTADGWFRTGDAGYIKDGELYITDRIKDLFKTSNGKYIAPQVIEGKLTIDRHFEQVVVVADRRKFVSALIVPNYAALEEWAAAQGKSFASRETLCQDPQIRAYMAERIDTLQQDLAAYEKIKRFVLLPHPFTMERGEITNTLKIKRRVVYDHYADLIEHLYAEAEAQHQPA